MNVLLTGSRGFVGSALTARLVADGHRVIPVVRRTPEKAEAGIDLARRTLDLSKVQDLDWIHAVFHLAGEPLSVSRWGPQKREQIRASRTVMTDALSRALLELDRPPLVLVSMSAIGYYGSRGEERLEEGSPSGAGFLADVCRSWEAATAPARHGGIRVVTTRMAPVIGRGGGMIEHLEKMFRLGLGGRLGSGRQWMSFISLDDVLSALMYLAADISIAGPVNLVSPMPVRNEDFTAALSAKLGRPAFLNVPRGALLAAFGRTVTDEFILASQKVLPIVLSRAGFPFAAPSIEAALDRALAFRR